MMARLGSAAEPARELAYQLYHICEQKKYAKAAQDYNALVQNWHEISKLARKILTQQAQPSEGIKPYDDH